ncbi:NmrA-like family protein [Phaeosphaeriaceae sp. PMI808]|nr:NmrA-like family protein [Phaeosphaeriaceae sp. PMI808]
MAAYQKIALLGKGFLGTAVVEQLAKSGFSVTILTRSQAPVKDIPSGVSVVEVNYDSLDSVTNALKGQDVVVNTISAGAMVDQKLIINAAIAAGIKRYVPADYGSFTTDPKAQELAVIMPMVDIQNYLKNKAAEGKIEWTVFQTGAFLDMIVGLVPLAFDPATKSIQWYDDGEAKFSTTTSTTIGKAIAAALKKPEETRNRVLFVHDIVITQKKLIDLVKKYVTAGPEWTETRVNSGEELQRISELLKSGAFDMSAAIAQLKAGILGGKYRVMYKETDNELLGLGSFSAEDLEKLVKANLAKYN